MQADAKRGISVLLFSPSLDGRHSCLGDDVTWMSTSSSVSLHVQTNSSPFQSNPTLVRVIDPNPNPDPDPGPGPAEVRSIDECCSILYCKSC